MCSFCNTSTLQNFNAALQNFNPVDLLFYILLFHIILCPHCDITSPLICINQNLEYLTTKNANTIHYFPIVHNKLYSVCPTNFAYAIVVKYSWEVCIFPRAFHNNSLIAKFGGQTECIMGNWKIENKINNILHHFESSS